MPWLHYFALLGSLGTLTWWSPVAGGLVILVLLHLIQHWDKIRQSDS